MIKVKTFPIAEYEGVNKLLEEFEVRKTGEKPDIIFHPSHICVLYEDYTIRKDKVIRRIENLLQGEEDQLMNLKIGLEFNKKKLERYAPKGFSFELRDEEIKTKILEANPTLKRQEVKQIAEKLVAYGNEVVKIEFTIETTEHSVQTYKDMLARETGKVAPPKADKKK